METPDTERETRAQIRRRRVLDLLRFLPVIGLWAWMLPSLWSAQGGLPTSSALLYIFGVWAALVLASAVLLRKNAADDTES